MARRAEYNSAIAADISAICAEFLHEFELKFSFQRGWYKESDYAEELLRWNFESYRVLTYTASGPHRGDFRNSVEGRPVEQLLSRGQLKLLICSVRLVQGDFLPDRMDNVTYITDDFASELDESRRYLLDSALKSCSIPSSCQYDR